MELDIPTFNAFRELVYARSGIALADGKHALVSARLSKRVHALGLDGFEDYLHLVESDRKGDELVQLLDAISTNVTHFYRENDHFEFLKKLIANWLDKGQKKFRVWCAASSTGEEPYTIAMTLHGCFQGAGDIDWKILATDISTRVLDIAARGEYSASRVRDIPPNLLGMHFDKRGYGDEAIYAAKSYLRDRIVYRRLNLSQPPFPLQGPLDLIMCRNVMIYFDNKVRARLLEDFHRLLKPGGYLIVGHSESLTGMISPFRNRLPSIYQKGKE